MAIVGTPYKMYEGWSGTDTTIVETYRVETDSEDTTSFEVIWESGTPTVGTQYPGLSLYQILQGGVSAERLDGDNKKWLVTVTYSATGLSIGGGTVDRLTAFAIKTRVYTRTADSCYEFELKDSVGAASPTKKYQVENSAADPFEPSSVQEEYYHAVLTWTQREISTFDYPQAIDFQGTLNQESITILGVPIARGKGLMRAVEPILSTDENGDFEWRTSYQVELAEVDHWLTVLDAGYNLLDDSKGPEDIEKRAILYGDLPDPPSEADEAEEQIQDPVALDGDGGVLGKLSDAVYGRFRTKPYKDWNNGLDLLNQKIRG